MKKYSYWRLVKNGSNTERIIKSFREQFPVWYNQITAELIVL